MKSFEEFLYELGEKESNGNYKIKNWANYLGKYQMGEAALEDAGYYRKKSQIYNNDWTGQFTGKDKVYSVNDFLNNPKAQENAQRKYLEKQWQYIQKYAENYTNKYINGNPITYSGLIAGAHNGGNTSAIKYMNSDGKINNKDGNGVPISEYIQKFSGYDISPITKKVEKRQIIENLLNPIETRIKSPVFKSGYSNTPTGYATPLDYRNQTTSLKTQDFTGYKNPLSGDNRIYTAEDIGEMTKNEFKNLEKEIDAQINTIGIPQKSDLSVFGGGTIYISPYTRFDGVKIKGHFRALRK